LKDLQEYSEWNRALANYCLLSGGDSEQVCLSISPSILAAAWSLHESHTLSIEEAEDNFVRAVSKSYCATAPSEGLCTFGAVGGDGLPQSIAFLGLSVLAAYKMHRDDEHAPNAYYSRLSDLLECGYEGGYPRGFDPSEFKDLWGRLRAWLKEEKGVLLAYPARGSGVGHIINIPLSHAPLRQMDLKKLPNFFSSYSYHPGSVTSKHKLERDFLRWVGSSRLTRSGLAALGDERRSTVMLQVAQELEAWDGVTDDAGASSAAIELQLDIVRHRPQLSYLPRRPRTFPALFDAGECIFESCEEGWYDPAPVPHEDGEKLAEGFAWSTTFKSQTLHLRRSAASAIALAPAPYQSGFVSRPRLLLNVRCAALCIEELADEASDYLKKITDQSCAAVRSPGLPLGWVLFLNILPLRRLDYPPLQLDPLDVETETNILPVGGLRLRRRQWLIGAPPGIFISGARSNLMPTIDGEVVEVSADGQLIDDGRLAERGLHIIKAERESLRLEITEPYVPAPDSADDGGIIPRGTLAALPLGHWSLIGAESNEVMHFAGRSWSGVIARTPFKAVWAVNRNNTAEAKVVCLESPPPPPLDLAPGANLNQLKFAEQWALAVLSSSATTPRIGCFTGASYAQLQRSWRSYVSAACAIIYSLRMARRRRA
jgi:hypothetical protein